MPLRAVGWGISALSDIPPLTMQHVWHISLKWHKCCKYHDYNRAIYRLFQTSAAIIPTALLEYCPGLGICIMIFHLVHCHRNLHCLTHATCWLCISVCKSYIPHVYIIILITLFSTMPGVRCLPTLSKYSFLHGFAIQMSTIDICHMHQLYMGHANNLTFL